MTKHRPATKSGFMQQLSGRLKVKLPQEKEASPKKKQKLTSSYKLIKLSLHQLKSHKKLFFWVGFWFVALRILAIGLPDVSTYQSVQEVLSESTGNTIDLTSISSLFGNVLGGAFSGTTTEISQVLQLLITIVFWLALIWISRQIMADKKTSLREALYNAPGALVPTLLILALLFVQLIPGSFGMFLLAYTTGAIDGISGLLAMGLSILSLLLIVWSVFMMIRTIIGLVVVSLPNTYPLNAFRTAKTVVKGRRFTILMKLLGLVIALTVLAIVLLVPPIILSAWLGGGVAWLVLIFYELFNVVSFIFAVTYLYRMYRTLI